MIVLNQYYKFLDKENYEKIQNLNQLAESRNEENFNPIDPNQDAVLDLNEVTE